MLLGRIELKNYGVFRGPLKLDLTKNLSLEQNIILVGGLNGAGKTTFLNCPGVCLYGESADCYEGKSYHKYIVDNFNFKAFAEGERTSHIELEYLIPKHNGTYHSLTLKREWTINHQTVENEKFSIKVDGVERKDLEDRQDQYQFVQKLMPICISHLFNFDGENVQKFAIDDGMDLELSDAMGDVLNINTFHQLRETLKKYALSQSKYHEYVKESDSILLFSKLTQTREQIRTYNQQIKVIEDELELVSHDSKRIKDWLLDRGVLTQAGRPYLEEELRKIAEEQEVIQENYIEYLNELLPYSIMAPLLIDIRESIAKEEAYLNAVKRVEENNQKIEELLSPLLSNKIVPALTENQLTTIRNLLYEKWKQLSQLPLTEEVEIYHSHAISFSDMEKFNDRLKQILKKLEESGSTVAFQMEHYQQATAKMSSLSQELNGLPTHRELTKQQNELRSLEEKQNELQQQLLSYKNKLENTSNEEERLELSYKEFIEKLREKKELQKKIDLSEQIREALKTFIHELKRQKAKEVEGYMEEMFKKIHQKRNYTQNFTIDPNTFRVTFKYNLGNTGLKEQLSRGEKQIYAKSLLWALGKASRREYPVMIDTPIGRLDSIHVRNLLENYFPYAGKQVIILSTDTEISAERKGMIKKHIAAEYLLVTDPAEHETKLVEGYFS